LTLRSSDNQDHRKDRL
jgi:hypothetical protein